REFSETWGCFKDLHFEAVDPAGKLLPCQRLAVGGAWGHANQAYAVEVTVPPMGYTTLAFRQQLGGEAPQPAHLVTLPDLNYHCSYIRDGRTTYGIENEFLRLFLDPATGRAVSLVDKTTGAELLDPAVGIGLEYSVERSEPMSAWILDQAGPPVLPRLTSLRRHQNGPLTGSLELVFQVERSTLRLTYRLDACSRQLRVDFSADWLEAGTPATGSPNLRLALGTALKNPALATEIPFGAIQKPPLPADKEVAALRWACLHAPGQPALLLLNDCKHGHALGGSTLRVNLIRSSFDPDPFPELGQHKAAFAVEALPVVNPGKRAVFEGKAIVPTSESGRGYAILTLGQYQAAAAELAASGLDLAALTAKGQAFNHPLMAFGTPVHPGDLPAQAALVTLAGDGVSLSCMKPADDNSGLILRLVNTLGKPAPYTLAFGKVIGKPKSLVPVDLLERPVAVDAKKIPAKGILTLKAVW
ncbi:MAG: hypothetical protein FWF96_05425, partial [Kiritimatiellaeota bacterium]|nr:hypothetical protein [Kiritimatiellota bacterium]